MAHLEALLNPRSIAVVGASPRGNRGLQIIDNLHRFKSTARIYPLHTRESHVAGLPAYSDIGLLPETCDFVAIALDADRSLDVLEQAIGSGVRAGLIIASGFGEGGNGADRKRRLHDLTEGTGFALCGPNCYGIVNASTGFAAYSGSLVDPFTPGNVALVMQSGALTHTITDSSLGRGLGLSHLITTGNEVSVSVADYLRALAEDDQVEVIGLFLEGIRNPDDFADAAVIAAEAGKPVVALTVGHSRLGQSAAMAHTGALAGRGEALTGFLRRYGVVHATDIEEFRELLLLFSSRQAPTGPGAAIASISGGGSGLLADGADRAGLALPQLSEQTTSTLARILPDFATVSNPLDLTGAAVEDPALASGALAALQSDPEVGLLVLALNVLSAAPGQEGLYRDQARVLAKLADANRTPVLAMSLATGAVDEEVVSILAEHGVPLLAGASASLSAITRYLEWHNGAAPEPRQVGPDVTHLTQKSGVIVGMPAMNLLSSGGIPTPETRLYRDADEVAAHESDANARVVLKVEAPGLAHKTEVGGVASGLHSGSELAKAAHAMADQLATHHPEMHVDGFLVQDQVEGASVECIVGALRDPQVGWVLTVAPGGVLAELSGPALTTPLPATTAQVDYLIDHSPLSRLLDGYRGAPPADRDALTNLVLAFGNLVVSAGPELREAELNPVLVMPRGRGATAVDALFVLEEPND